MELTRYFMLQWRRRTCGTIAMSGDEILVQTEDCEAENFETPVWLELALSDNAILLLDTEAAPVPEAPEAEVAAEPAPAPKEDNWYRLGDLKRDNAADPDEALKTLRAKLKAKQVRISERRRMVVFIKGAKWVYGARMIKLLEG